MPLAIAALGAHPGAAREAIPGEIAQAQQPPLEPLQPAVPFPGAEEDAAEPAAAEPDPDLSTDSSPVVDETVDDLPTDASPAAEVQPAAPAVPPPAAIDRPVPQFPSTTPRRSPSPFSSGPLFENLTLTRNADPSPKTIRGISGGPIPASDVAGRPETATGPCLGFVDTQPDHILTLTQAFDFLSLQVQSAEDTTLVVKGPGGSWCNDNYLSLNPGIAGQWLPGRYEIWIGSHRNNGYFPYVIRVLQQMQAGE